VPKNHVPNAFLPNYGCLGTFFIVAVDFLALLAERYSILTEILLFGGAERRKKWKMKCCAKMKKTPQD
jgi:hypothetical protein